MVTMALNLLALWKQEPRDALAPGGVGRAALVPRRRGRRSPHRARVRRFLLTVGLGTAGFSMQDVVLEPYGGEILGLPVGATTVLTALLAAGALVAFALAARMLARGAEPAPPRGVRRRCSGSSPSRR